MGKNPKPADEDLMLSLRAGSMAAFEALYDRYYQRLFHYVLRFVKEKAAAEDILQETFIRMLKARRRYRKGSRFSTYLFTVARNLCLDALKSWEARHLSSGRESDIQSARAPSEDAHQILEASQMETILHRCINALPDDQKEVIILSKFSGLTYEEISRVVGSTPAAVKQRAYRALRTLKQGLK